MEYKLDVGKEVCMQARVLNLTMPNQAIRDTSDFWDSSKINWACTALGQLLDTVMVEAFVILFSIELSSPRPVK